MRGPARENGVPLRQFNLLGARSADLGSTRAQEEDDMVRALLGAVVGGLVALGLAALLVVPHGRGGGRPADPWTEMTRAQATLASGGAAADFAPLVALSTELRAVERQRRRTSGGLGWLRGLGHDGPADDPRVRGFEFLVGNVRRALHRELDAWETRIAEVQRLEPGAREAALRLLASVKWQIQGGELRFAYERFDELAAATSAAPPIETETTNTPEVAETPEAEAADD